MEFMASEPPPPAGSPAATSSGRGALALRLTLSFIVGPVLSVGLSVAVFPEAGPLLGAVLLLVGTLALAALRSTEPPVQPHTDDRARTNILRMPVLLARVRIRVHPSVQRLPSRYRCMLPPQSTGA